MAETSSRLRFALKLAVSGGLLAVVFSMIPLDGVARSLLAARWELVALCLAVMFVAHYVKSIQMHLLTKPLGITLSPGRIFVINLITKFYGLFLPGIIAGGAIRWYHLSREDRKPAQAFAAIIMNRVLETSVILGLGLGFWLLDRNAGTVLSGRVLVPVVALSVLLYLLTFSRRVHALLLRWTALAAVPDRVAQKLRKVLASLGQYEDLSRPEHLSIVVTVTLHHLLGLASLALLARAVGIEVGFATLGWIRSLVTIATLVPVTIAGLGIREASFVALLGPFGVPMSSALTLSLLVFGRGLAFAFAGGLLEARRLIVGKKEFAG